ncbi:MAG TPA: MerR family transcriptional regulator [Xanthobacteraceae bacterium]|nr:MerR family transcriptional regulator [Xanthobacteraceae bacterium]
MDKAPDAFRTISEVAEDLDVPQHVLRFWESRFSQIRPMKRGGGRRYYRPDDVDLLRGIRHLLYGQGYTIRGVQRILREQGPRFVQAVWQDGAPQPPVGRGEGAAGERGMFGLWPAMGVKEDLEADEGEAEADDVEEPEEEAPHVHLGAAPQPAPSGLSAEDIERLRAILDALIACRERLDSALGDPM